MKTASALAGILVMAASIAGCVKQESDAAQFQAVNSDGWSDVAPAEFTLDSITALRINRKPVDIDIHVRYSVRNAPATLPLVVLQESYMQPATSDTLLLTLRNAQGEPTGKGSYGVYTATHTLRADSLPDGWRLTLYPPTGAEATGIQAVGYAVRK